MPPCASWDFPGIFQQAVTTQDAFQAHFLLQGGARCSTDPGLLLETLQLVGLLDAIVSG